MGGGGLGSRMKSDYFQRSRGNTKYTKTAPSLSYDFWKSQLCPCNCSTREDFISISGGGGVASDITWSHAIFEPFSAKWVFFSDKMGACS